MRKTFCSFLTAFLLCSCNAPFRVTSISTSGIEIQVNSRTPIDLYQKWYFVPEENRLNDTLVLRNENYDFPPIRFRKSIQILKNGTFFSNEVGQSDKPITFEGVWVYDSETKSIMVNFNTMNTGKERKLISSKIKKPVAFEVFSVSKELLLVKIIPARN